jgi:hypothetical protein
MNAGLIVDTTLGRGVLRAGIGQRTTSSHSLDENGSRCFTVGLGVMREIHRNHTIDQVGEHRLTISPPGHDGHDRHLISCAQQSAPTGRRCPETGAMPPEGSYFVAHHPNQVCELKRRQQRCHGNQYAEGV